MDREVERRKDTREIPETCKVPDLPPYERLWHNRCRREVGRGSIFGVFLWVFKGFV